MAIKNKFFKTTQGVPYELVVADSLLTAAGTTLNAFGIAGPLRRTGVFVENKSSSNPVSLATNVVIPVADRKKRLNFSYTVEQSGATFVMRNTTQLRADSITAELVAYAAPTLQVGDILNAGVGTLSVQQRLVVKIIETTPMNRPMPSWDYDEALTLGQTAAFAKIIAKIALAGEDEWFTAAAVANGMRVTSTDASRTFKIVASIVPTKADPSETGVYYTYTEVTPAFIGSGTLAHIQALEIEDNIRRGVGHYYTPQGITASEMGLPVAAAGATTTFDIVVISGYAQEVSPTPVENHLNKKYIFVCVPPGEGAKIVAMFAF